MVRCATYPRREEGTEADSGRQLDGLERALFVRHTFTHVVGRTSPRARGVRDAGIHLTWL